jgi:hypothetical protein
MLHSLSRVQVFCRMLFECPELSRCINPVFTNLSILITGILVEDELHDFCKYI